MAARPHLHSLVFISIALSCPLFLRVLISSLLISLSPLGSCLARRQRRPQIKDDQTRKGSMKKKKHKKKKNRDEEETERARITERGVCWV